MDHYGIYWGGWFMVIMVYIGWVVRCNYGIYWVGGSW